MSKATTDEVANLLTNIAQIIDAWKHEEEWSGFDREQRNKITELLEQYHKGKK